MVKIHTYMYFHKVDKTASGSSYKTLKLWKIHHFIFAKSKFVKFHCVNKLVGMVYLTQHLTVCQGKFSCMYFLMVLTLMNACTTQHVQSNSCHIHTLYCKLNWAISFNGGSLILVPRESSGYTFLLICIALE